MENLEQQASVLFGAKEYAKALEIYLLLLQGDRKSEKYAISCGNCYDALNDKEKAIEYYEEALKYNRDSEAAMLNLSTIFYELKNFDKSSSYAIRVLNVNPKNISAIQNMANIRFCNGQYDEALAYYQQMYQINPNSYIAMINIANTYYCMGKYVLALEFAKKSIKKHPSSVTAHMIAGNALAAMDRNEKALQMYIQANELDYTRVDTLNALSNSYHSIGDWENCLLFSWRYLKLAPQNVNSYHLNFGYLLYECYSEKSVELACKYAQKWLKRFPENKVALHMGNAILNNQTIVTSDTEYVKEMFDNFAPDFDSTLNDLDYQAPNLIYDAVSKNLKKSLFSKYHIADLGCGTGLCGEKLKKYASFKGLIGIDLSEKMLDCARRKKIYSQLICDDLCHYLENSDYLFHLITASDVWTYFGELTKPFVRISRSLLPNGLFVFTFSENIFNKDDYFLTPSGRFVHNPSYVEKVLKNSGLRLISCEHQILRNEAESPVYGYVVVARKPDITNVPVEK